MAFIETFLATSTTLACAWLFKKFIEPKLEKGHKKVKGFKKKFMRSVRRDIK
jgi:hypothetical protein